MFDPLSSAFVFLFVAGLKSLADFLASKGFKIDISGWASLAVASLVSALIVYLDAAAIKLPPTIQVFLPAIVAAIAKFLLVLFPAMGAQAVKKALSK